MITGAGFDLVKLGGQGIDVRQLHLTNDAALIDLFYTSSEPYSFLGTSSWGKYATEYFRESIGSLEYHTYGFFVGKELTAIWSFLSLIGKDN